MEKALGAIQKTKTILRPFYRLIEGSPFWAMALFCLFLRLFVKRPLGALLALIIGCVWVYSNMSFVKIFCSSFRSRMSVSLHGYEKQSLWYEHEGRGKIDALIARLSADGVCYCNLAERMGDLPPASHWYAISIALKAKGVTTQISGKAFYISWRLQNQPAEE